MPWPRSTGRSVDALAASLRSLVRREILALISDPGSPERGQYTFIQGVIREVAYETLARKERRARHLAAARYFETLDSDELAGILASHYLDAYRATPEGPEADALAAQARIALRGAAERAASLGSHGSALGYFEKALTVTTDSAERTALWEAAATAAFRAARFDVSERYGRLALDAHRAAGNETGIARSAVLIVQPLFAVGKTSESAGLLEAALADCPSDPDAAEVVTLRAELGRALMVNNDRRGLELVERSLIEAERLRLVPTIADALITKAAFLDMDGRNVEGVALVRGAIDLAVDYGLVNIEFRARANLASQLWSDDTRAALRLATEARERARSLGLREHFRWLSWMCVGLNMSLGSFDDAIRLVAEVEEADLVEFDLDSVYGTRAVVAAFRGQAEEAARLRAAEEAAFPEVSRPDFLAGRYHEKAQILALAGDLPGALATAIAGAEMSPNIFLPAFAMRCAVWSGDREGARRARGYVVAAGEHGRFVDSMRRSLDAALAALEGRREEAVTGFREAASALRDLDSMLELGLSQLDHAVLIGPADPVARAAADEARAIFERIDSPPLLERLRLGLERWEVVADAAPSAVADDAVPAGGSTDD